MRSEEEIIDLIVNRDESVMSELMDKYQRPLMRLAMNMLDSEEDARECVNDTFYEPKYLFAYSATICRHLICKRIEHDKALKRSSNVIELTSEMEQCIGREDNLPDGDEERLGELLDQFLKGVPVQKRNMFIQRYWYSEPIRTIAQLQGKSESTVKVTLHRMRKELKLFLENTDVEL